jgi:hypothetical protein
MKNNFLKWTTSKHHKCITATDNMISYEILATASSRKAVVYFLKSPEIISAFVSNSFFIMTWLREAKISVLRYKNI